MLTIRIALRGHTIELPVDAKYETTQCENRGVTAQGLCGPVKSDYYQQGFGHTQ